MTRLVWFDEDASGGGLPVPLDRAGVLSAQCSFQGLSVDTTQYGRLPMFEPAVLWLDDVADRLAWYAVKRAAGDTCACVTVSGQYREANQAYANVPGKDFSSAVGLATLRQRIVEALTHGGMRAIRLMLAGDGDTNDQKPYNDPQGMTYGYDWLMANFATIHAALADFDRYLIYLPGFDGVVPAWQPWQKVNQWLLHARDVVGPAGYLGLELSAGYWAWSGEHNDYATEAGQCLDLVLYEGPYPMGPPDTPVPANFCQQPNEVRAPFDQFWQISKRLLGSKWRRPAEMPECDDPGMAPDLPMTPRGPIHVEYFEYDTYGTVRGLPPEVTARRRAYARSVGWAQVG